MAGPQLCTAVRGMLAVWPLVTVASPASRTVPTRRAMSHCTTSRSSITCCRCGSYCMYTSSVTRLPCRRHPHRPAPTSMETWCRPRPSARHPPGPAPPRLRAELGATTSTPEKGSRVCEVRRILESRQSTARVR